MKALVTRPGQDADGLAAALALRGLEPLLEPLLAIRLTEGGARRLAPLLAGSQAVLFTSANGVRAFAAATKKRHLPALAVGDATAKAARAAGFPVVMSAGGTVADLARLVLDRLRPADGTLLHAAARDIAGDLAGRVAGAGFTLRRAVLYEAVPAAALSDGCTAALRQRSVACALFFSPRSAASFVRLAAAAGVAEACRATVALALSPAVAAALGAMAWQSVHLADHPTEGSLLAALDRAMAAGDLPRPPAGQEASA